MKLGYIYLTSNLINGRIYIGQRLYNSSGSDDLYYGSGIKIKHSIKKHGKCNFKKEILATSGKQQTLDFLEAFFIKKFNSQNPKVGYNILPGTANKFGSGSPMLIKEVRDKCSESAKKYWNDDKQNKIKDWIENRKVMYENNLDMKKKLSELGKKLIGSKNPNFGKKWTQEMKDKARLEKMGKYDGENNPNFGKKWSDENKKIASDRLLGKQLGKDNPNYRHGKDVKNKGN